MKNEIIVDGITYRKVEEEKSKRWRPEDGEEYYRLSHRGWDSDCWDGDQFDEEMFERGNVYKTQEEVEARDDLRRHIWLFDVPEVGDEIFRFVKNEGEDANFEIIHLFHEIAVDMAKFEAGLVLPSTATDEDKVERIRLLNLVYKK